MCRLGLVDGEIVAMDKPVAAMEDRGYQFGDGIYEFTKVHNGRCFALQRHLARAYRSLRELRIPAVYTEAELTEMHERLIRESGVREGGVYFQITRGAAPRNHLFPRHVKPRLTMSISPYQAQSELIANGAKVAVAPDERWLRCDIKSLNLLGNVLAKQRAHEEGYDECILVRQEANLVTEGCSSNFYVVKDGVIWTHPISNLILNGVSRMILVEEIAPKLGLTVLEKAFTPEFARTADEAFLTQSGDLIIPVVQIGRQPVAGGAVGPVTAAIVQSFHNLLEKMCPTD